MIISTTKKIKLTNQENMILHKAEEIIAALAKSLDDYCYYYADLARSIEAVRLHEPWEIGIEEEEAI